MKFLWRLGHRRDSKISMMRVLQNFLLFCVASLIFLNPIFHTSLVYSEGPSASPGRKNETPVRFPVHMTDAAGRAVTLKKCPERIVVIGRGPFMILHVLYMFPEAVERIAGMEGRQITVDAFLGVIDPFLSKKTILGMNPGPEQVAVLKPDLVLIKGRTENKITHAFDTLDIPVIHLGLETPEQFFKDVKAVGMIFGNPSRADEIAAFYQTKLDRLERILRRVKESEKPRVLVLEYSDRGGEAAVKVPANSWMQTIQALRAGGRPVWTDSTQLTDGWTVVHFEQIAAWDPDKIFVITWYTLDPGGVMDSLKKDPHWRMLKAVKAGELYAFPSDIIGWDTPDPRWILGMIWMAANMYPDYYKDLDMNQEIFEFFDKLYGIDRDTIRTKILPKIRMVSNR